MEILNPILQKLQAEAIAKKEAKLSTLLKLALEDLEQVQKRRVEGISLPPPPSAMVDDDIESNVLRVQDIVTSDFIGDRYYKCYKLGCQPWQPAKLIQTSLDAIQKLTAHGLLSGEENWEANTDTFPKEFISLSVCLQSGTSPFDSSFGCSESNNLSQFDRFWSFDLELTFPKTSFPGAHTNYQLIDDLIATICACYTGPKTDEGVQLQVAQVLLTLFVNSSIRIHSITLLKLIQTLINMSVFATKPVLHSTPKAILTQVVNLIVSRMEECNQRLHSHNSPTIDKSSTNHEVSEGPSETSPKMEVESVDSNKGSRRNSNRKASKGYSVLETLIQSKEQLEEDSLLVLYLLCHLSLGFNKPSTSEQDPSFAADNRCRAITLELVLSMLNNSGRLFHSDQRFNQILQRNLGVSLTRNGIATDPSVFELSLSIFIVLFTSFRASLKSEIGVIFKEIYLRLLNMQTSTYYQKSLILQALMKICRNPQAIVDMYVNYDCHLGSASIFESMMDLLSKIAQGRQTKSQSLPKRSGSSLFSDPSVENDIAEDRWLKVRGLRCLVTVIHSLVEWSKGVSPKNQDPPVCSESKVTEFEGLPVVVNKNHLDYVGNPESGIPSPTLSDNHIEKADAPARIQQNSSKKQIWRSCVQAFNQSPKKGLITLQTNRFVNLDSNSIASFFLSCPELSKEAIGEYLGFPDPECIQVMHAFVDHFDFTSIPFVSALRNFLQSFRLPREAQKIDRILEKFADRYCETNPQEFENADTAYILSFSIMMLNTDQHSNQVREKMDLSMFIQNNRGINNGKDVPEAILVSIFEDIARTEIIMEEEHFNEGPAGPRDRLVRYNQEAAFLQKKLLSLFQTGRSQNQSNLFMSATHAEHVKPMFEVAWYSVLAAFSLIFEEVTNITDVLKDNDVASESIKLCLEGFEGAIRISCLYYMETERNAFISSLVKFTSINMVDAMRTKNVVAIQTLISLANTYGEFLNESWELVLEAISRMDKLQLFNDQTAPQRNSLPTKPTSGRSSSIEGKTPRRMTGAPLSISQDLIQLAQMRNMPGIGDKLNELHGQSAQVAVDKIFNNSTNFSGVAIVHFYRALCNVSLQEVEEMSPRTHSLQKIVEITYYNMKRIRLEWTPIWKILRPYFNTVGCHTNHAVAVLAVDSLRQLGMRFFERDELTQYHTQHEFLKPFEHIARHSPSPAMLDLILQSLSQMISSRASRIKSGWRSLFTVLGHMANRKPSISVLAAAFKLVRQIFDDHFSLLGASFVDGVNCLVSFSINQVNLDIASEALQLLQVCANPFLNEIKVHEADADHSEDRLFLKWFPVLSGLSRVVIDCQHETLREQALARLFETLTRSGTLYNKDFWNAVLRSVLMPIFDDVRTDLGRQGKGTETWMKAMSLLINLFETFYAVLATNSEFVKQLFGLIGTMLTYNDNEKLTRHALTMFKTILTDNSARFEPGMWVLITNCLEEFFVITTPRSLFLLIPDNAPELAHEATTHDELPSQPEIESPELNPVSADVESPSSLDEGIATSTSSLKLETKEINVATELLKCGVHLTLLQTVKEILGTSVTQSDEGQIPLVNQIPPETSYRWLQMLLESARFAHRFNCNVTLRHHLWTSGYLNQLPHLIRQETVAYSVYFQMGFMMYREIGDSYAKVDFQDFNPIQEILDECIFILQRFATLLNDQPTRKPREISNWSSLVCLIFHQLSEALECFATSTTPHLLLTRALHELYTCTIAVITTDRVDVRLAIQRLLTIVGAHFFLPGNNTPH